MVTTWIHHWYLSSTPTIPIIWHQEAEAVPYHPPRSSGAAHRGDGWGQSKVFLWFFSRVSNTLSTRTLHSTHLFTITKFWSSSTTHYISQHPSVYHCLVSSFTLNHLPDYLPEWYLPVQSSFLPVTLQSSVVCCRLQSSGPTISSLHHLKQIRTVIHILVTQLLSLLDYWHWANKPLVWNITCWILLICDNSNIILIIIPFISLSFTLVILWKWQIIIVRNYSFSNTHCWAEKFKLFIVLNIKRVLQRDKKHSWMFWILSFGFGTQDVPWRWSKVWGAVWGHY